MIAPDPAPAGPRPAANPRDPSRGRDPQARSKGDFDSVLADRPTREGVASTNEAAPAPDTSATPGAAAGVLAVPVPIATPPVEAAAPPVDTTAPLPAAAALPAAGVPPLAQAPVPVPEPPFLSAPVPMPPPGEAQASELSGQGLRARGELPRAELGVEPLPDRAVAPKPSRIAVPAEEGPTGAAADRPLPAGLAEPEASRRATASAEAPAVGAVRRPETAAVGEGAIQSVALRDAAPPTWQLAADTTPAPMVSRAEAVAQSQAPSAQPVPAAAQTQAVQPQAVIGQVAVAIALGKASDDRVEIRLDPPELGRVQIHLTRLDGGIQAVVLADRPETQDLLRRHAEALARELGAAGYDTVSLDFAAGHEARPGRDERRDVDWAQIAPAAPAGEAAEPVSPAQRRSLVGRLDVRL